MHRMGMLGPIDPSVANAFNPPHPQNPGQPLAISVEDVTAYFDLIQQGVGIHHEDELIQAVVALTEMMKISPCRSEKWPADTIHPDVSTTSIVPYSITSDAVHHSSNGLTGRSDSISSVSGALQFGHVRQSADYAEYAVEAAIGPLSLTA